MPPTPDQQNPPAADNTTSAATPTPSPQVPVPDAGQGAAPIAPADATSVAGPSPAGPVQPGMKQRVEQGTTHVLGDIFQTLAGGQKIVYTQGPNGPVKTYQDLKPGEMARGILAAAITGLASGYDPANRGKGPAMSSAFASGFKGEEQAREKQQGQEQQQAQQQFANKNMADELILKKQQAAREQQESITRMAESTAHTAALVQQAKEGAEIYSDQRHQHVLDQMNQFGADMSSGYTPLKDGLGRDISFATPEEALDSLNKDPRHLLHPGDFDTKIEFNPNTSRYEPVLRPKNYEDKTEIRFVKLDKDGKPERDKDGKYVPSGQKGPDGQVMPPTPMTGAQYGNWVKEDGKAKMDSADYAYKVAATRELEQKQKDDAETKASTEHFYQAGGDPFRVDVNTGAPYMNDRERGILVNQAKTMTQMYGNQLKDLRSQLTAAASDEERAALTKEYDDVKNKYDQFSGILGSMKPVDKATALANSLIAANTTDDKLNAAGALNQMDTKQKKYSVLYSPPELAAARKKIQDTATAQIQQEPTKEKNSLSPLQQNIVTRLKGQPIEVVTQQLDLNNVDPIAREGIYKGLGLTPPPAPKPTPAGAETIKNVVGAVGHMIKNPNDVVVP